ncbi:phospholipase A [Oceanospirillum sediminis]|uniref:Phospholipase A1 n=1 Tax=Oceanospirillum sediminis TaxID=2760088 RepID=A0A839IQH1_9GAMM|nr:phospholipase A [Oceanospirillum sediminis]MBB1487495.1 phospholipase A [Oceanospirillum sediminis]
MGHYKMNYGKTALLTSLVITASAVQADVSGEASVTSAEKIAPEQAATSAPTALRKRIAEERQLAENPLIFLPYRANFFLPASYYSGHEASEKNRGREYSPTEAHFQLSLKFPIDKNIFLEKDALFATYTQESFWQIYESSAPFRESVYEPEIIYRASTEYELFKDLNLEAVTVGLNHQSNGQGGDLSRSWNRAFIAGMFASGDWGIALKRWFRIPESESDDDNPDLDRYVGLTELGMAYSKNGHVVTLRSRNHLESGFERGNLQLSWSFPIGERYKGYILARTGYGDTLADYRERNERIGIGISINDVL